MTSTGTTDHVSPLTAMLYPAYTERCGHCGGFVAISPEEALKRTYEAAYQPWAALAQAMQQPSATAATGLATAPAPSTTGWPSDWMHAWTGTKHHHGRRKHRHDHDHDCGCGCDRCGRDDCHCECCVVNADLVVNVRLGERRLVPLTIENDRRREREVKLELSEFTSKGGRASGVTGRVLTDSEFTLGACEEREVLIGIEIGDERGDDDGSSDKSEKSVEAEREKARTEGEGRKLPDVDECRVAYADLRIVGCDNRPIRIAVATLPRDCHDYRIDCGCACCC